MIKKKRSYLLALSLIVVFFIFMSFLMENRVFFDSDPQRYFTDTEFFVSSAVLLLTMAALFYLAVVSFKVRIKWWLPIVFFLVTSLLGVILFPGVHFNGQLVYSLNAVGKIRFCIQILLLFIGLYICLAVIPKMTAGSVLYNLVFIGAVLLAFGAIIWSYYNETQLYVNLFSYLFPSSGYLVPKSFTANRNIYGFILFYGLVGEVYLAAKRPAWWRWFILLFLYFNQFFVLSKTSVVIATLFLALAAIWFFVRSVHAHPYRNISILVVLIALTVLAFGTGSFNTGSFLGWIGDYYRYVTPIFLRGSSSSFLSRIECYNTALRALQANPFTFVFGFGFGNWVPALYSTVSGSPSGFIPMDNAWAVDLLQNGIFGVVFSLLLWIFVLFTIIKSIRRKDPHGWVVLFLAICVFARTFTEAGDFTFLNATGVVFFLTIYLPLAADEARAKEPEAIEEANRRFLEPPQQKTAGQSLFGAQGWYMALALPFIIVVGLGEGFAKFFGNSVFGDVYFVVNIMILFFALPIGFECVLSLFPTHKVIGFFASFLFAAFTVSEVALPFLGIGAAATIIPMALLAVVAVLLAAGGGFSHFRRFSAPFLEALAFTGLIIGLNSVLVYSFRNSLTGFLLIAIGFLDLIVWFSYVSEFSSVGAGTVPAMEDHFLKRLCIWELREERLYQRETSRRNRLKSAP